MFEQRNRTAIAASVLALLVVAGCGDGDGEVQETGEPAAEAESPVDPATAGDIQGTVHFEGEAPQPETIDMSGEPDCAETYDEPPTSQEVVVGEEGTLTNVFVYVREGLEDMEFPTPEEGVEIDQEGCRYVPHVLGLQTNQTLVIRNSDGLLHNINTQPSENRGFNISQPVDMTSERTFPIAEVMIPVRCDVHGWMNAYIGILEHPFHSVSGEDGSFELSTLPPGEYVVEAWHERYGTQTETITVAEGETTEIDFTFSESMAENADVPLGDPIDLHDHGTTATDADRR